MVSNPVFAETTRFTVPAKGDRVQIAGREQPELAPGIQVRKLPEPVELVEIATRSGNRIRLSPESMFSLIKSGGDFVSFNPPVLAYQATPPIAWDAADEAGKRRECFREWFLIGAILAAGTFSADWNRPTRLVLPDGGLAEQIVGFLRRLHQEKEFDDRSPVLVSLVGVRHVIATRVLDLIVGQAIEAKTMRFMINGHGLSDAQFHAFASGLFLGMDKRAHGAVFQHRDRATVEHIHHLLRDRAGICGNLVISNMEPTMQRARSVSAPHRIEFDERELTIAAHMGLTVRDHEQPFRDGLRTERVLSVTPVGRYPACVVHCEHESRTYCAANWFLFRPTFEENAIARRLATMDEVFSNPSPITHLKIRDMK